MHPTGAVNAREKEGKKFNTVPSIEIHGQV
jgi:hypothetical protein